MLEKLTEEQEAMIDVYRDKWLKIGLSCEPTNRKLAEEGAIMAYEAAGLAPPKHFVWRSSPLSGLITASILFSDSKRDFPEDLPEEEFNKMLKKGDQIYYYSCYGQHDAEWLSFYDFFKFCGVECTEKLNGLIRIAENSGWFWPFAGICVMSERPVHLHRDEGKRLHCDFDMAIKYPDGTGLYRYHGVAVDEYIIMHPEQITIQKIEDETNAEVKRVMMERYGYERYIVDCGSTLVEELPADYKYKGLRTARLFVKEIPNDETIVFVDLLNSTPEPNGTVKRYWKRVDPTAYNGDVLKYCHAAAASTWRDDLEDGVLTYKDWEDYAPSVES